MFLGFVWRPVLVATEEWVRLDRKKQGEGVEWEWYGAMAVEPKLSIGAKLSTVLLWSGTLRQPDSVAHQEKHERNLWFILYTTEWLLSKTGGQEYMAIPLMSNGLPQHPTCHTHIQDGGDGIRTWVAYLLQWMIFSGPSPYSVTRVCFRVTRIISRFHSHVPVTRFVKPRLSYMPR
jgi:hypothetical protein